MATWIIVMLSLALAQSAAAVDEEPTAGESMPDYRTVTILEEPFMMLKKNHSALVGNAKYEGFIVDLLREVADRAHFQYRLYLVEDSRYGVRTPTGDWTGMVGDILDDKADIIAAPLTTTPGRAQVIDFSETFMSVPLTLLVQKGVEVPSLEYLISQDTMQYGAREGGIVADSLMSTPERPFSEMWAQIASFNPSTLVESNEEGIQRVEAGNFSYLLDKPSAEYISHNTACGTDTQLTFFIGDNNASYAFGMPKEDLSAEEKEAINSALRETIEDGTLEKLRAKWWKDNCPGSAIAAHGALLSWLLPLVVFIVIAIWGTMA